MNKELLLQMAEKYGTPLYIFNTDVFRERAEQVKREFGEKVHC